MSDIESCQQIFLQSVCTVHQERGVRTRDLWFLFAQDLGKENSERGFVRRTGCVVKKLAQFEFNMGKLLTSNPRRFFG